MCCKRLMPVLLAMFMLLGVFSVCAQAETAAPGWEVISTTTVTNLAPGSENGVVTLDVYNLGEQGSSGPVTVTDTLPHGVIAVNAGDINEHEPIGSHGYWNCAGIGTEVVTCSLNLGALPSLPFPGYRYNYLAEIGIQVKVEPATLPGKYENHATVTGGDATTPASTSSPFTVSATPVSVFGFTEFDSWFGAPDGTVDTQAGSHPNNITVNFGLNMIYNQFSEDIPAGGEVKNLEVNLPPGIVGNPTAVPQCTAKQFVKGQCPAPTQVGWDTANALFNEGFPARIQLAVYNLVPPPGIPAQFGFILLGNPVYLDAVVRSGSDYGITEDVDDIPQDEIVGDSITLWGEPSNPVHNAERFSHEGCEEGCASDAPRVPFLTLPTSCNGPQEYSIDADTWENTETSSFSFLSHDNEDSPSGFTGCDHLAFTPTISVAPDTSAADTPAGLTVDVRVPQEGLVRSEALAMSDIKNTTVTLPAGVNINPGQAAGLQACGPAEDGLTTETEKAEGRENNGPASCPSASKVGTLQITTPLLKNDLEGDVYVMQSDPPNLKLLFTASGEGVYLKLVANVHLNETTGQLTTTLTETPELPFTNFKLSFSGGAQAALTTPTGCGTYTTTSDFTPWSATDVGDAFPTSSFAIDTGTGGTACPTQPLPFAPSMIAGSTTDQAGGYTDFSLLLSRPDDQQRVSSLQFKTPEGLLGMISKVPLCPEPQAAQGTCSQASQIGHTVVEAGPGPYPLVVPQPGQPPAPIYLTGGYKGAPYGLSIVVPLVVGPFTLQTQVVRAKIEVNPITTQLTVTTDPLPSIIDGIPSDLRTIDAVIDKPGFMFNPTGCQPMSFSGTATSTEGAQAPISSHFQVGSCQSLQFKPDFKVSTSGKTSRANGASLDAKILYPTGTLGDNQASNQSNVASVKVDLPKQLPSRLTTLQKACTAATFEANPANCPADSRVGQASAVTPVLPVGLSGPAYFVSYGGAKFPELVIVLQGYGVTVDLHGETFINSKTNVTSSTFRQVPDVPITSFELNLPQGPFSALAANGNLCTVKGGLKMPTAFTGHNGAVIHQNTPINVTGCPKHKQTSAKTKKTKDKSKKRK